MRALIVDGANVVGSRPDGWWRDRPGAARRLWERLAAAELPQDEVVLVLEGAAKRGAPAGREGSVATVVTVVTADRELKGRVEEAGALTVGPSWLLDRL